ncbi:MAG: DUF883 domain-containing protein [Sulfitobacter sp.]|nr:DUF883 domain-containing protein [Sulfitobacter sp.]
MATQTSKVSTNGKTGSKEVSVNDLSAQIELLKKDIADLTSSVGEFGKAKTAEAKSKAKKTVEDIAETGKEKALETQLQAEEFVRTQPATALGIAAGIGFLIGLVTARR